jgi:hypothetical protein
MPKLLIHKLRSITPRQLVSLISWKHVGRFAVVMLVIAVASTQMTYAIDNPFDPMALMVDSLANFFYSLQTIASWLIYLAGSLLNFSINLTMHIKEFVNATPAIYTVWKAIRDISGMFIIFALLYSAIRMIIGMGAKADLIKNIVIAGVLINFSFFITGLAIDVSNVVSIQLYNAIAPAQNLNIAADAKNGVLGSYLDSSSKDGGLSTIFMQSLGVTRLYNPSGGLNATGKTVANTSGSSGWTAPLKIIIISITSIIIMITATLSFFLAALAFIVRFVILLFLLAFSPILFASHVVPEIDKYAGDWKKMLKSQLVFMPVYLLLMYFALSVLTSSSIFKNGYAGALTSGGGFLGDLMVLAVNAVLVIVMLNFPLVAAMSVMGKVPKWAEGLKAENIWKKVGGYAQGGAKGAWNNTAGLALSRISNSAAMRASLAKNPTTGRLVSTMMSKVSSGYDKAQSADEKATKEFNKRIGKVDRGQYDNNDDYRKAKTAAEGYQATHRQFLTRQTILGRLVNSRGAQRAGFEMEDKAGKAESAKNLKENRRKLIEKEGARDALNSEIRDQEKDLGLRQGTPRTEAQKKMLADLEKEIVDLEKEVDRGEKEKEDADAERLASKVNEKTKGDSSGEKEKDKGEPKK